MSQNAAVQSPTIAPGSGNEQLKSERVQEMLQAMPAWALQAEGQAISRVFQFPSARVAAKWGQYVSAYAEEAGHNFSVSVSKGEVSLTLAGPKQRSRFGDLTAEVIAFAQKLG